MAPKVAVCIPTYNRQDLIQETIDSVLAQTSDDYQIFVLDNCSTDDTAGVVASYGTSVEYRPSERPLDPMANWSRAVYLARDVGARYFMLLHDDDRLMPTYLETMVALLDQSPFLGMAHCAAIEIDAQGARGRRLRCEYPKVCKGPDFIAAVLLDSGSIGIPICSASLVRTEIAVQVGPFNSRLKFTGDINYWIRVAALSDIGYVREALLEYRVHGGGYTHSISRDPISKLSDRIEAERIYRKIAAESGMSEAAARHAARVYVTRSLGADMLLMARDGIDAPEVLRYGLLGLLLGRVPKPKYAVPALAISCLPRPAIDKLQASYRRLFRSKEGGASPFM